MGYYGTLAPFVGMAVGLGAIGPLMNAVDKLVPPIPVRSYSFPAVI